MSLMTMLQKIKREQGSIVVLTAVLLPVFLGFMGIGIDVGNLYMHKARLQNVADAAALAGAREFVNQKETPDSHDKTDAEATKYINNNLVNLHNSENVTQDGKSHLVRQSVDGSKTKTYYRIGLTETVGLNFLPILPGINRNATVQASAVALAEGTVTSSNPLPSVPVSEGASFSIFDNLFTFSEFLSLDKINENSQVKATFDGRIVYTLLNNNTETGSSNAGFFYDLGEQPGISDKLRHVYSDKGGGNIGNAHVNDPYLNPYFSTRDYAETFKEWLKTDENGNKLYVEFTSQNDNGISTDIINAKQQQGDKTFNVFYYNNNAQNLDINITSPINTIAGKFDENTPVYILVGDKMHINSVHVKSNVRPVVLVYYGTSTMALEGCGGENDEAKLIVYAPDATVRLVNFNMQFYGNIIAKMINILGSSHGRWFMKNFLENEDYTDQYIRTRRETIEAAIMANAAAANSKASYESIINAVQDYLGNGHNFTKHANEILALFGYLYNNKHGSGYEGSNANDVISWYNKLTDSQKRALANAVKEYLYGSDFGSGTGASGGSGGGTSQSVDASSVKIRLISDSELKDTPFASL